MSNIEAGFEATETAFHVEGYEKIEFDLLYVPRAFAAEHDEIADSFRRFGRCLMIIDETVHDLYGDYIEEYFTQHGLELTMVAVQIAETDKTWRPSSGSSTPSASSASCAPSRSSSSVAV
jgi:hypothetical protein